MGLVDIQSLLFAISLLALLITQSLLSRRTENILKKEMNTLKEEVIVEIKKGGVETHSQSVSGEFLKSLGFKTERIKQPYMEVYHVSSGRRERVPIK